MYQIFTIQDSLRGNKNYFIQDRGNGNFSSFSEDISNPDYQAFKTDLANGVALEDANGTAMTADQIKTFMKTLP